MIFTLLCLAVTFSAEGHRSYVSFFLHQVSIKCMDRYLCMGFFYYGLFLWLSATVFYVVNLWVIFLYQI